jgi:hypothetical protein
VGAKEERITHHQHESLRPGKKGGEDFHGKKVVVNFVSGSTIHET